MYHLYNYPTLPFELSLHIYKNIQCNAANIIIREWYKRIQKKTVAVKLVMKIIDNATTTMYNNYNYIDCFSQYVKRVLQYCSNVLTGTEDREWWIRKLDIIAHSIYTFYSYFNRANIEKQKIYLDICLFYKKINDKFYVRYNLIQNNLPNIDNIDNINNIDSEHIKSELKDFFNELNNNTSNNNSFETFSDSKYASMY